MEDHTNGYNEICHVMGYRFSCWIYSDYSSVEASWGRFT